MPRVARLESGPRLLTTSATRTRGGKWMRIRSRVLRRDCGICLICRARPATEVDHITPLDRGGSDDEANLQSVCAACHQAKTTSERRGGGSDL